MAINEWSEIPSRIRVFTCETWDDFIQGQRRVVGRSPFQALAEPTQTMPERALPLIEQDAIVRKVAAIVGSPTPTYTDLYIAYETIRDNVTGAANKWKVLAELDWATEGELQSFYDTAHHFRHGYPRKPLDHPPMPLDDASELLRRLFRSWIERRTRLLH